jgi:chromosome condensin MukBEF MukE localization factor
MNVTEMARFPEVDTALRMGAHITSKDFGSHEFVAQNFSDLSEFYASYGAALIEHPDSFYFLNTADSVIPSRALPKSCMHLGKLLAYLGRDEKVARTSGTVRIEHVLQTLSTMFSAELLRRIYAPTAREGGNEKQITKEVERSLRLLAQLGFIELDSGKNTVTITPAIGRFADLARHDNDPSPAARKDLEVRRGIRFEAFGDETEDDDERGDN